MNATMMALLASPWVGLLLKATLVLASAGAAAVLLGRRASAARHLAWTLAVTMLLLLPLAALALPGWRVAVLPVLPSVTTMETRAEVGVPAAQEEPVPGDVGQAPTPVVRARAWRGPLLAWLWAAGAAAVLAWLLVGRIALRYVLRGAEPLQGWDEVRRDAAWLLEVERPVRLYRSGTAAMPMTWGVVHPVVMLPAEADGWAEEEKRAVLLHELAHVKRYDCLTQLVAGLACALWWFHPGVWYAAHRMRVERERACDQMVLAAGTSPTAYAAQLLELARRFHVARGAPLVAVHMARGSQLEGRLLTVLAGGSGRRAPSRTAVLIAAAAVVMLTLPLSALQPAPMQPTPPERGAEAAAPLVAEPEQEADTPPSQGPATAPVPAPAALPVRDDIVARTVAATDTPPAPQTRHTTVFSSSSDSVARLVRRVPLAEASYAIVTRGGGAALLLRDTTVVLQLTDRGLSEVAVEKDTADGFLSVLLRSMVRGGLRVLLDRGIEYSLTDLREARVEDGRLVLKSVSGDDVFGEVEFNGRHVMEEFDTADARRFAARVNAARARMRR